MVFEGTTEMYECHDLENRAPQPEREFSGVPQGKRFELIEASRGGRGKARHFSEMQREPHDS